MKREQTIDTAMQLLWDQLVDWGWTLEAEQFTLLRQYAELLTNYTEANVIGTKEVQGVILDHVLDSLSCLALRDIELHGRLIDVGSGGGMPGIPLAIAQSDLTVTLLEATEKKVKFLRRARESLQLTNVSTLNQRAEEAGRHTGVRESYDIAVTRALASLPVVVEYCAPFVKEGGWILAMKGWLEQDELVAGQEAAKKLGAELHKVASVRLLPELEQKQRQIVVLRKMSATPSGYPRRVGLAKKRPLGS